MNLITELQFLPSLYYCSLVSKSSGWFIEQYENYNKGGYRNKTIIKSNTGSQYIGIPLKQGKNNQLNIREVEISYDENWIRTIEYALQSEYGKLPYFDIYFNELVKILHEEHYQFLYSFNLRLINWQFDHLQLPPCRFTQEYVSQYPRKYTDIRNKISPSFFRKNPDLMTSVSIDYFHFTPAHSVLETLFSYGPETKWILDKYPFSKFSDFL